MPRLDLEKLTREGYKYRVVSVRHLTDLQSEIECRIEKNQFDEEFQQTYMYRFSFSPPAELENAKSVIVVAMPRPATKAVFNWNGQRQAFILPPTYTVYDQKRLHAQNLVAEAVGTLGYRVAAANLPLKLLAVRSGLAEYGRNNIAYVEGMGSFMRLTAVYSDMPVEHDVWHGAKTMHLCQGCDQCQNACPTGAIPRDRFMLNAECCLTFHNEKPGSVSFPGWIKTDWHNAVVGCIKCQEACPKNKPFLDFYGDMVEFSQEETELLLNGTTLDKMSSSMLDKMQRLSLMDYFGEMPRNLSVLLKRNMPMESTISQSYP